MTINEIKKILYKSNVSADFVYIRKGYAYYKADLGGMYVNFEIPVNDMGDADFLPEMPAKLLNRWIILSEEPVNEEQR